MMQKHFVTFLSPGTLVAEDSTFTVDSWDVNAAMEKAHTVVERHNATPFAFFFTTRSRGEDDLDSKVTAKSPTYYLGGEVFTREEIEARNLKDEIILRDNMRSNDIKRIIINRNSWKTTQTLHDDDVVLDWKPRKKE
jgi:hypothetical protein